MINIEKDYLKHTSFAEQYQLAEGDRIRYGIEGPMHYQEEIFTLDHEVERVARTRVFTFISKHDPTFLVTGTVESAVNSNYAR